MITVDDIFGHIAQELRDYNAVADGAAIEEFLIGCTFDFHLCITDDVEEAEADFMDKYGKGSTFYFRLADYEHGKLLAGQMHWIFLGHIPDMSAHTGDRFKPDNKLSLFVHLANLFPPPVKAR